MVREFLSKKTAITIPSFMAGYLTTSQSGSSKPFSRKRDVWPPSKYELWLSALRRGEVVIAPAEGVYGYSCDPFNEQAVLKLCSLKNRSIEKGLLVIVRNERDLLRFVDFSVYGDDIRKAMKKHWPGQTTLVVPAKKSVPHFITGGRSTVAIRMPEPVYMQEYLGKWGGALVSTSCNEAGMPPARRKEELPWGAVALTMPNGHLDGSVSVIYNVITGEWIR